MIYRVYIVRSKGDSRVGYDEVGRSHAGTIEIASNLDGSRNLALLHALQDEHYLPLYATVDSLDIYELEGELHIDRVDDGKPLLVLVREPR